jgi:hypothetical protein
MPPEKYAGRTLTLYFASEEEVKKLHRAAEKAKVPYATFCREMIRRGMELSQKPDAARNGNDIREELAKAKRDLARQEERNAQLEAELFAAKHAAFMDYDRPGQGQVADALVDLLKSGGSWRSDAIMKALGIDPKNIDAIRALAGQLRALQDLKLVVEGHNGWRWADE